MTRIHSDWLEAFLDYTQFGEAPKHMYFWAGVSAIAGALRRKVWIDQAYFKWYPNFYICLVAPPGIVSKSTTAGIAMNLLRRVPGIKFGPDVVTWPALVSAFAESTEGFEYNGMIYPMSAMTLESSEFGNLLNPQDKEMVDLLVALWDGKQGNFEKTTKHSGNDVVENPWINLIACTTPAWIAGNFPEYMVGGGFTSRTIFVYADAKEKYVAYPGLRVPPNLERQADALVNDLTENGVAILQPRGWHCGDEELATVGARSGVSHGKDERLVEVQLWVELVLELVARSAHTGTSRVTALQHEVRDDSVEDYALVKRGVGLGGAGAWVAPLDCAGCQTLEVGNGLWCVQAKQVYLDGAVVSVQGSY